MSDCSEPLLASSIPDLRFDLGIVNFHSFCGKLDTNGRLGLVAELVGGES